MQVTDTELDVLQRKTIFLCLLLLILSRFCWTFWKKQLFAYPLQILKNNLIYYEEGKTYDILHTTKEEKVTSEADDKYKTEEGVELSLDSKTQAIFYDGTTDEQRNLYDYAVSLTEACYHTPDKKLNNDANMQAYYKNIYNQMITRGYTTYNRMIKEGYMNATETDENVAFKDDQWLITQ